MIEEVLAGVAASPPAAALRASRYAYPVVNAAHILGLSTLFGAILALDLRLLGAFRTIPARPLALALPRVAAGGLLLAVLTGAALFSVEPQDYAGNPAFLTKISLVAVGTIHALTVHVTDGWRGLIHGNGDIAPGLKLSAALSILLWTTAILAGRLIAFLV